MNNEDDEYNREEYNGLEMHLRLESLVCFVFHSYIYSTNIYLQIYYAMYTNVGGMDNEKGPKQQQTVVWALVILL